MIGDFFLPGSGFVYRFDPRAKIICLLGAAAAFFYPLPLILMTGILAFWAVLTAAGTGIRELLVPFRAIFPLLVLVAVLTPLFNREGRAVLQAGNIILVTAGGLEEAVRMILRFSGVTLVFFLYFRTTELTEILLSLRWFGMPFRAALIVTVAFRYIPHLSELYGKVRDAHTLRRPGGGSGKRTGPLQRMAALFPTLTSVLIQAVKSIDPLAMALEVKGVGRKNRRSSYGVLGAGLSLYAELLLSCIIIAAEAALLFL